MVGYALGNGGIESIDAPDILSANRFLNNGLTKEDTISLYRAYCIAPAILRAKTFGVG